MKRISLLIAVILLSIPIKSQTIFDVPLSDRQTGYDIDVRLYPDEKKVSGSESIYWVNTSDGIVGEVLMHLYLNAFRSNKSTFYRETGGSPGNNAIDYGWIEVNSVTDAFGNSLKERMQFVSPDDGNPDDMTVLKIDLLKAANPGDTVWLDINFTSKLPSTLRRTGYADDFFFVAQWFPKFGVYETPGMRGVTKAGWNCHQFHSNSEFYSNHSVYNVSVTLPPDYVTGSGGMIVREEVIGDTLKKVVFRAEDIVDFAWTAWPDYKVANDTWEHVSIRFLYPPGREDQVDRQFAAVRHALQYLSERVGPFPWPHLTFVDPPAKGAGAGGMEYTTIFTSTSVAGMPSWVLLPDMVTVHEFGHSYFMGMLATNEFEDPWMDEGINSYWEVRIMDHFYGPDKGILNHKKFGVSDRSFSRLQYVGSDDRQVSNNDPASWEYPHGTYAMMSYQKAATWLMTLQGIIGEETIDKVFAAYYDEWAFRHPGPDDFIDVVSRVVRQEHGERYGESMDWFFEQTLYGTGICDYKLDGISNRKIRAFKGIVKSDTGMVMLSESTEGDTIYNSTVRLQRLGEVMLPVEILVHFESGEEKIENWNGLGRYHDITYKGSDRVIWAIIDPENKITMDVDPINNSYTINQDRVVIRSVFRKFSTMVQLLIQSLSL